MHRIQIPLEVSVLALACHLCAAADPKQIAELADRQFGQIKAVTVEATLTTRDPTNGQRLRDSINLWTGSGTASRAMSVQEIREQTRREKAAGAVP